MNQDQTRYAMNRVNEIKNYKLHGLNKKHAVPAIKLSFSSKYQLIKQGKVKLRDINDIKDYVDLVDAYDFSSHQKDAGFDKDHEKAVQQLNTLFDQTRDEIMLGDSQEAIRLLEKLESFKI